MQKIQMLQCLCIIYLNIVKKAKNNSLWNYYRDEPSDPLCSNSESFRYKNNITGNTQNIDDGKEFYGANKVGKNETEVVIPLTYLSNFIEV